MQSTNENQIAGTPQAGAPEQLRLLLPDAAPGWFQPDDVTAGGGWSLRDYLLFFALFPPDEEARRISGIMSNLQRLHGLGGTLNVAGTAAPLVILSHRGLHHHQWIGEWALADR